MRRTWMSMKTMSKGALGDVNISSASAPSFATSETIPSLDNRSLLIFWLIGLSSTMRTLMEEDGVKRDGSGDLCE
jgi:hypothetical protein